MAARDHLAHSFDRLLQELQAFHNEEVSRLRDEISELRAAAANIAAPPRLPLAAADAITAEVVGEGDGAATHSCSKIIAPSNGGGAHARPSRSDRSAMSGMLKQSSAGAEKLKALMSQHAPSKRRDWRSRGRNFIKGPGELIVGFAIILNVMVVWTHQELEGRSNGMVIGAAHDTDFGAAISIFSAMGPIFASIFFVELCAKLFFFGRKVFVFEDQVEWFNVFDAVVVVLSVLDSTLLTAMQHTPQLSVLRGFRVIRIIRVLRVARTLKVFASLRVLVAAVFASFFALFWSMVLLGIMMIMAALFMCQVLGEVILDERFDDEMRSWAYHYYGTSSRATWTLFELTFSGGWPNYARPLVEHVGWGYGVFFFVYISTVVFAMFRVITAMFLKDTLRAASMDIDTTIAENIYDRRHYTRKLLDFFIAADTSGDGYLSIQELDTVLADEKLRAYLSTLELDATRIRELFAFQDGAEEICIEDFVLAAMRLKGAARSQDVASLIRDLHSTAEKVDDMHRSIQRLTGMWNHSVVV